MLSTKLYYVDVEDEPDIFLVYKDCVFTTSEKCKVLLAEAIEEYGKDKVEICHFELDPNWV